MRVDEPGKGRPVLQRSRGRDAGSPESRTPDFFLVGAAKSGTSSLYTYLVQHPDVFLPEVKEPHFFYNERSPGLPVLREKDLGSYLRLFEGVAGGVRAGEASTSYLYSANAAREIKQLREDAKILAVLRNPVNRAYSQYWNQVRDGQEHLSFEAALDAEEERKSQNWWHGFLYTETGHYAEQIARYMAAFGHENVQIHLFDDLHQDAREVCSKVFSFLEVDPAHKIETNKVYNRSGPMRSRLLASLLNAPSIKGSAGKVLPPTWKRGVGEWLRNVNRRPVPEMNPKTRERLRRLFMEDLNRLEDLIGRDLGQWKE